MENTIPNRFYRVSIKALIFNESRDKFLVVKEESGKWELPGGGLDWGEGALECLRREISEEMSVPVVWMAPNPSYFLTYKAQTSPIWVANVLYETEVEHLNITPSDECVGYEFISKEDVEGREVYPSIRSLADMFDPKRHIVR